ncbi:DUF3108 domain-containing protein [Bacteroides mediterraneensis]|uniref:DUF3108 domain-containing protein n=1 Tax=Bacteroides mediterraneensis TaxID=1841856 RepID=A0ABS2EUZ6_9BACE|nr:DUF3108 domain-containing protein [Bacteroides mediterraneensis]MBM6758398.1 DUF3108 domain-containing protein [Bacteroides mediterraneensis]
MIKKLILCLFLLVGGMAAKAQCGAVNDAIKPGETLSYELKFNWKFVWINAGWAKMTVNETKYKGIPCLKTDLQSYTNKKIDFFFKMRDTLTCITSKDLVPLYFRKGAEEGKRYTVDEVKFSYQNGKCIVDQQRTLRGHTDKRHDVMPVCVYDMLSILLQARSYDPTDYKPGQKILFSMATGREVEKQTLIYRRKENYKAENGVTYRCLVFSLVEYVGEEKKEKEVITFYVTDDRNHLPVRLDMYLNFGSAKAFLTDIKGNRHPLTSVVKEK